MGILLSPTLVDAQSAQAVYIEQCGTSCNDISANPQVLAAQLVQFGAAGQFEATSNTVRNDILDQEIAPIARGESRAGCGIDGRLLQMLVIMVKNYGYLRVSELNRGCAFISSDVSCANSSSLHCEATARAVDLYSIGSSTGGGSRVQVDGGSETEPYLAFLNTFMPPQTNALQGQCGRTNDSRWNNLVIGFFDDCTHQHIDLRAASSGLTLGAGTPSNPTPPAIPLSGMQMIIDGNSAVWAKGPGDYSTSWSRETGVTGGIVKIAAGGGIQLALDSTGKVWQRSAVSSDTGWTAQTGANGAKDIAVGSDGTQMLLDNVGAVWAKTKDTSPGSWSMETPQPGGIVKIAANGGIQMALDSTGKVFTRTTVSTNQTWTLQANANSAKDIAIGSDGTMMIIDTVSAVWAKTKDAAPLNWTRETSQPGGIVKIATNGGIQLALDSTGKVWHRNSVSASTAWTGETGASGAAQIAVGSNGMQMILDTVGQVWIQPPGQVSSGWTRETPSGHRAIAAG
ncbi:hypothetical protein [Herbiconiux liangxiaofengii]